MEGYRIEETHASGNGCKKRSLSEDFEERVAGAGVVPPVADEGRRLRGQADVLWMLVQAAKRWFGVEPLGVSVD